MTAGSPHFVILAHHDMGEDTLVAQCIIPLPPGEGVIQGMQLSYLLCYPNHLEPFVFPL